MENEPMYLFVYLTGDIARQAYEQETNRGYFETEDAWLAFDFTEGVKVQSEFLMEWQAQAFAATDMDADTIWSMNSQQYRKSYNAALKKTMTT